MKKIFVINRPDKYGGKMEYKDFKTLEDDFISKKVLAYDLKIGISDFLIEITQPIRDKFSSPEAQLLLAQAYPMETH